MFDYGVVDVLVGKKFTGSMEYGVMSMLQAIQGSIIVFYATELIEVVRFAVVKDTRKRMAFDRKYGLRFSCLLEENFYPISVKTGPPCVKEAA